MALVLYRAAEQQSEAFARYAFSDSSPLFGKDWCMNTYIQVRKSKSIALWQAACLLERASTGAADQHLENESEIKAAHELLLQEVQYCVLTPANVELGHVDVVHKASALCFALAMESPSRKHLLSMLASFRSLTTDMGTELSVSSLNAVLGDLLPPWWRPTEQAPAFTDGEVAGDDADMAADFATARPVLPNCIAVAGMCHITHNLEMDLDSGLEHFATWYDTMRVFSTLLCNPGRRKVLYSSCLADTVWSRAEVMKRQMEDAIPYPYEKRWGHIHKFLAAALPFLQILRHAWNEHRYVATTSGRSELPTAEFNPTDMSAALKDVRNVWPQGKADVSLRTRSCLAL
eukprot:6485047-Amphidinium_carterae.2